jgi:hypothetical protein
LAKSTTKERRLAVQARTVNSEAWTAVLDTELDALLDVAAAAYVLKHEGRAELLHDALYALERATAEAAA